MKELVIDVNSLSFRLAATYGNLPDATYGEDYREHNCLDEISSCDYWLHVFGGFLITWLIVFAGVSVGVIIGDFLMWISFIIYLNGVIDAGVGANMAILLLLIGLAISVKEGIVWAFRKTNPVVRKTSIYAQAYSIKETLADKICHRVKFVNSKE